MIVLAKTFCHLYPIGSCSKIGVSRAPQWSHAFPVRLHRAPAPQDAQRHWAGAGSHAGRHGRVERLYGWPSGGPLLSKVAHLPGEPATWRKWEKRIGRLLASFGLFWANILTCQRDRWFHRLWVNVRTLKLTPTFQQNIQGASRRWAMLVACCWGSWPSKLPLLGAWWCSQRWGPCVAPCARGCKPSFRLWGWIGDSRS